MQYPGNDELNCTSGMCKTWKMTDQITGLEIAVPGKWKTKSHP